MPATTKKLTATLEDGFLVVRVPLNPRPVRSGSGKTLVIASTHGNQPTELEVDGKPVIVGLNAYVYAG